MATAEFTVTTGGKDYLEPMTDLMTKIFEDDPAIRFMLSSLPDERRRAYMRPYMHVLMKAAMLNHGIFQQANDWACGAVWMPPGKKIDNPMTWLPAGFVGCLLKLGFGGCKRMLIDFQSQSDACKKKGLKQRGFRRWHYLFFIGTDLEARGKGLASNMIEQYQVKATEDNLPIWLEATTEHSRNVYARCGFETVETMELGVGTHNAQGVREKNGPGIRIWAMIWKPKGLSD